MNWHLITLSLGSAAFGAAGVSVMSSVTRWRAKWWVVVGIIFLLISYLLGK